MRVTVIGSLILDTSCVYVPTDATKKRPDEGSSNRARITRCIGGAAHNIALTLHRLGVSVQLVSFVGEDDAGGVILDRLEGEGLDSSFVVKIRSDYKNEPARTGQHVGMYDTEGGLLYDMADVEIMKHPHMENEQWWWEEVFNADVGFVVIDSTISHAAFDTITKVAQDMLKFVVVDPVSVSRAKDLANTETLWGVPYQLRSMALRLDTLTPNIDKLQAICDGVFANKLHEDLVAQNIQAEAHRRLSESRLSAIDASILITLSHATPLLGMIPSMVIKAGVHGCFMMWVDGKELGDEYLLSNDKVYLGELPADEMAIGRLYLLHLPAPAVRPDEIVNVNGAGDSLVAGFIAVLVQRWRDSNIEYVHHEDAYAGGYNDEMFAEALAFGQEAARLTLLSKDAVSSDMYELQSHRILSPRNTTSDDCD